MHATRTERGTLKKRGNYQLTTITRRTVRFAIRETSSIEYTWKYTWTAFITARIPGAGSFRNGRTSVVARCQQRKRNVARLKEAEKGKAGQSSDALARCADIPLALRYARPASPDSRDYFPPGAPRFTFSWRTMASDRNAYGGTPDWRRCDKGKVEGGDREQRKMAANRGALLPSYKEAL